MKRVAFYYFFLCLHCVSYVDAQIVYHDADSFPLYGKATQATTERYVRLPDSLQIRFVENPCGI